MAALKAELITELDRLELLAAPWQALAHVCASPSSLPGWQLAWWRHLAPENAPLRVVAVFEGEDLVGLAPFFVNPGRRVDYRLLGAGMTRRMRPLARPDVEDEVARAIAGVLARATPAPDLIAFEGVDRASPWPRLLAEAWPGFFKPWRYLSSTHPGPTIDTTSGDLEAWQASRSRNFRKQLGVAKRRADEIGARIVPVRSEQAREKALRDFRRLHLARWEHRGGSAFSESTFEMIDEAVRTLVPANEMRISTLETAQDTVAVLLALVAGREILLFSYGFDEAYAQISPIHLIIQAALEDAFKRGDRRVDFGGGSERHKQSFANSDAPVSWEGLVIRSRRYPLTRARLAPAQCRWFAQRLARKFLSPAQRSRIKRLLSKE
jgi:CelD/BcsL family acetyltransferase involved in cellulose biosynthesis